jgi:hypothetical protein
VTDEQIFRSGFSRRAFLGTAGAVGVGTVLSPVVSRAATVADAPVRRVPSWTSPSWTSSGDPVTTPRVGGLHVQFGLEASTEVTVSWHTLAVVGHPRVLLGAPQGTFERSVAAREASYVDAKSGREVHAQHARITGLQADTEYVYAAVHDGAEPEFGSFRTAPAGRAAFTFTSFGDQGTPTTGRRFVPPPGVTLVNPPWVNDNLGSPAAADVTAGVERVRPLFHLFNGDLCYANLATDRVRTWSDFWENNSRSARNRPWMPAAGNHENELGNGPIGYQAYQTYFALPRDAGQTDVTAGLWYAFTVGSVHIISLANDDVCYQDSGNSYVRGYSAGAQKAWLERELTRARANADIDWIVVCMHQVAISTASAANGADLGIRQEWLPLFDRYGVDLVVCGHEHHYERSHPIRSYQSNQTLTPLPAATRSDVVDTSRGTVHMVIGGGGTSAPSNQVLYPTPQCRVITAVGPPDAVTGKRPPIYVVEDAPWSAVRNVAHPYGFAAFTVDPGTRQGGVTTMSVTYYDVVGTEGQLEPFESFTLQRPRSDAHNP